VQCAEDED